MDSESVVAADGADCAIANGEVTMEGDSSNGNGGTSENLECCSTQHPMEASEGTQNEQVDDSKQMRGQKVQGRVKHEKTSGGKNIPSVLVKKKKDGKVVASNGSVAPNVKPVKSPKSKSLNGREAHVTKHGNHDSLPAEGTRDKPKLRETRKQVNDTSEDDTQYSPKEDDGKPRRASALPNYGFSFRCDQRAEKRREFYSKLEEKIHAKEEEKNTVQAKSKETQEAELKMLRKSLNFKATPMPTFYQEPQLPKTELKKIAITRPKSPKLGRKKTNSRADSEEAITIQTPRFGRLSLDEKTPKDNPVVEGSVPGETKKPPVRKSLPRLPSEKTNLSNGKVAPAKAVTASTKAKSERKKPDKDVDALSQSSPVDDNADPEDSQEQAPRVNEDRNESHMVVEVVAVEP